MIDKEQAKELHIQTAEGNSPDAGHSSLIDQIKSLLPNLVNSDGQVDVKALTDAVDSANTTSNNQGYELTFAGKGLARAQTNEPTKMELQCEPQQSKNADDTENVVIRGDNLDVLKILYQNYFGKIKMIYIDPPYNTRSESFIYKDNFKESDAELIERYGLNEEATDFLHNVYGTRSHSGWLNFMYPRLKLARDLLRDDGVIFISIDDNEQANLKIICDEIFGENNFIGNIGWESKTKSQNTKDSYNKLQPRIEYILCYAMQEKIRFNLIGNGEKTYMEKDDKGPFRYAPVEQMSSKGMRSRESMRFPILGVEPDDGKRWKIGKKKIEEYEKRGDLILYRGKPHIKMRKEDERQERERPFWAFFSKDIGTAESAKQDLSGIMQSKDHGFDSVKPVSLIQRLAFHATENKDIAMDFFAGSGTTGDAIMRLNAEDGGNRKFILVQWDEDIDRKNSAATHKFCKDNGFAPVISSICIERLNRAGDILRQECGALIDSGPDIGYKVFSLRPKPCIAETSDDQDSDQISMSIESHRKTINDTLINMLAATCKPLHTKLRCIVEDKLYQAIEEDGSDGELYMLADLPGDALKPYRDYKINLDGWADINLTQFLNLGVHNRDNITVIY